MKKFIRKFIEWYKSFFKEEYELSLWFHSETVVNVDGSKTLKRTKRTYVLSSISKKTPTHIIGKDSYGKPFEIKTVEPFDYIITKTV